MAGIDAGEGSPAPPPQMSPQQRIEQVRSSLVKLPQSRPVAVVNCHVLFWFFLVSLWILLVRDSGFVRICW
jgi:hypothetical protein